MFLESLKKARREIVEQFRVRMEGRRFCGAEGPIVYAEPVARSRRGPKVTIPDGSDAATLVPTGPKAQPVLVVLTGPQVGQRIRLEAPALIGRDPVADLMLVDREVEWHHARVEPRDGGWAVVDLTESRKTEVNGMRVAELLLTPEDQLIIGATVVRYEVHDPIEQAYDEAVVQRLFTDELTGLLARRKFDVELKSAVSAATERTQPLTVIVLDIDALKPINDLHGHLVGSRVIAEVGRAIGAVIAERYGDAAFACRLGGDEYAVALPDVTVPDAWRVAEQIRERVAALELDHAGTPLAVRISGGLSTLGVDGTRPLELLRNADGRLYQAKSAGGDRIESVRANT